VLVVDSVVELVALPLVSTPCVPPSVVSLLLAAVASPSVASPVVELTSFSLPSLLVTALLLSELCVEVSLAPLVSVALVLIDSADVVEESAVLAPVGSLAVEPSWCPPEDELP